MREALDRAGVHYAEYLPARDPSPSEALVGIARALEEAHYPSTFEGRDAALLRLAFDELLALQLGMVGRRRQRGRDAARPIADRRCRRRRAARLAHRRRSAGSSARTVDADRRPGRARSTRSATTSPAPTPMLRLLQGDVGSGKTAVAAWALAAAAPDRPPGRAPRADGPARPPAPRDARGAARGRRRARRAADRLADRGGRRRRRRRAREVRPGAGRRRDARPASRTRVEFAALGVVVIDEQHRFGVEQRGQLEAKAGGHAPHVLLMTATPIPRTLGQVLYADLDVSDLRTPPEGRIPIRTGIRHPDELALDVGQGPGRGGGRPPDVRRRAPDRRGRAAPTTTRRADDLRLVRAGRRGRVRPAARSCSRRSGSGWSTAG